MIHVVSPATPAEPATVPFEDTMVGAAAEGQSRARREGAAFDELAYERLEQHGATIVKHHHQIRSASIDARIKGHNGKEFWVLAHGNIDIDSGASRPGLRRTDTIRKAAATAHVLNSEPWNLPVLLLTSHLPAGRQDRAATSWMRDVRGLFWDVISINSFPDLYRLRRYLTTTPAPTQPEPRSMVAAGCEQLSLDAVIVPIPAGVEEPF